MIFELNINFVLTDIYERKIIYKNFIDKAELVENFINFLKDNFSGLVDLIYLDVSCIPEITIDKNYTYSIRFLVSFHTFLGDSLIYLIKLNEFKLTKQDFHSCHSPYNEVFSTINYSCKHLDFTKNLTSIIADSSTYNFLNSIKEFDFQDFAATNYFYLGSYNKDWEDFFKVRNIDSFDKIDCNLLQFITYTSSDPLLSEKSKKISFVIPELSKFVNYPYLDFLYDEDGNWAGFFGDLNWGGFSYYSSNKSIPPNRFYTDKILNLLNFAYLKLKGFVLISNNVYSFDQNSKNYIYHSTYKEFWSKVSLDELFNFLRPHLLELRYFTFNEFKYRFYDSPDFTSPYGPNLKFERNPIYFRRCFIET